MIDPSVKTDQFGWKYYEALPKGFRLASMDDFHVQGTKRVGMEYLIQRANQPHFEIHYLRQETKASVLQPFIKCAMVFVRSR